MAKRIRIVTTSLATFEDTHPPFNIRFPGKDDNLELAKNILETASSYSPDVVLLPEVFLMAGHSFGKVKEMSEAIPGPGFEMLSVAAKEGKMNIIAGHMTNEGGKTYNNALVIDRNGELIGAYYKNHPTEDEINNGVTPGSTAPTFQLDFGKVGVAICFDINWPGLWQNYAEMGVDFIAWLSAYEGGFPLQAYAWQYKTPIVTSVWSYHGRVIDLTGEILAETSRWDRVAAWDMNLDRGLFHTDGQMEKIQAIRKAYGDQVKVRAYSEMHIFIVESLSTQFTVDDIIEEYDLLSYEGYIQRCTQAQKDARVE